MYPETLSEKAKEALEKLGVTVITGTHVTEVNEKGVRYSDQFIEAANVIWAAGNQASPLLKTLDVSLDHAGRVQVNNDLSIQGYPEIFVIGDASIMEKPLPGIAPVAIQQGHYVAKIIKNEAPRKPFVYFDKGSLATIGKNKAVGVIGRKQLSGFTAWIAWSFIHILYLNSFANRFSVAFSWIFLWITGHRSVRIIKKPIFEKKINML